MARKKRPPGSPEDAVAGQEAHAPQGRRRHAAHQHPELIGLGLLAFGLFMATVLYVGWNGGYVGKAIGDGFVDVVGGTAYVLPVACVAVGALMVGAERPAAVRPVPYRARGRRRRARARARRAPTAGTSGAGWRRPRQA